MTLTFEPATHTATVNTINHPTVIIINPRSRMTGIAIDYGFTRSGEKVYVRWSKTLCSPYSEWCEITMTEELHQQYIQAIDMFS